MRHFARWAESVIVEWRLEGTCVRRVSRTADVGEMGLFVETAATLERGTRLFLELPAVAGCASLRRWCSATTGSRWPWIPAPRGAAAGTAAGGAGARAATCAQ